MLLLSFWGQAPSLEGRPGRRPSPLPPHGEQLPQLGLRCCGVASYQDWQQNLYFNCSSPGTQACSLPASCCISPWEDRASVDTQCGFGALRLDEDTAGRVVHLEGCGPALLQWLHGNIQALGGCAIAVVVVQGAELLLAAWLLRALAAHKALKAAESGPL